VSAKTINNSEKEAAASNISIISSASKISFASFDGDDYVGFIE